MVFFIPSHQRRALLAAAQSDLTPLLLVGAPGTGKSAIARWVHAQGPRAGKPWIEAQYDMPLTQALLQAHTGTLVLHDIAERCFSEQRELLSFLKTKSLTVHGVPQILDVRIIATSAYHLDNRVLAGLFHAELFAKLSYQVVEMPALRERRAEFEEIVSGVLQEVAQEEGREYIVDLTPQAIDALLHYSWPGNIRELRNVLRSAVIQSASEWITEADLPELSQTEIDFRATRMKFAAIYGSRTPPGRRESRIR